MSDRSPIIIQGSQIAQVFQGLHQCFWSWTGNKAYRSGISEPGEQQDVGRKGAHQAGPGSDTSLTFCNLSPL